MKKLAPYILLVFLCTCFYTVSNVQAGNRHRIDSLKNQLTDRTDTNQVRLLIRLSGELLDSNLNTARVYAQQSAWMAQELKDVTWEARSLKQLGTVQFRKNNYDSALFYFEPALAKFKQTSNAKDLANIYMYFGNVYFRIVETKKAVDYYQKSLSISLDHNLELQAAHVLNNLGNIYLRQLSFDEAEKVFMQSLEIRKRIGSDDDKASCYNNLGNLYLKQKKWDEALKYYLLTLEIDLKENFKLGLSGDYNNIGLIYKNLGNYDKALEYHLHSLKIDEEIGNARGVAASLTNLGTIYTLTKQCDKAITSIKKALQISEEKKEREIKYDCLRNLAEAYFACEQYKLAAETQVYFRELSDSIYNEKNQMIIESLRNELSEKQQQIELEKKEAEIERQKELKYTMVAGLLLLMILIVVLINRRHVKQKLISEKQQIQLENKALYLQMNPHFIFNSIGAISGFISQNHPKTAIKYLAKFAKLMRNTLEHSKRSVISIKDEVDNLNHYILLEQLRFNNRFDFELLVEPTINQELLIPAMFIQPYVENAIVHGIVPSEEKGSIRVEFFKRKEQLVCTITDNGIGRKKAEMMKADSELEHLSSSMEINEKRVKAINAMSKKKMKIEVTDLYNENGVEKGTRIELIIYPKTKE